MVKQGYKQTEIGVIPEDWEVRAIGETAPLKRGFDLPISTIVNGEFPVVFSNGINKYHNKFLVNGPGIVTGRSGTIGNVFYVEDNFWPHNTSLFVTSFNKCYPKYIYYLYKSIELEKYSSGSGVPTLNRNDVHDKKIPLPPLAEQEAIATALSDADAWIASLEQLIAKKRLIKQGAMQELLTPPSPSSGNADGEALEPWEVKKLGEVCDYKNGKSLESKISDTGVFNIISLNSIDIRGKLKKDHHKTNFNDNSLKKGDIVMVLSDVAHGNFLGLCDIIPDDNYVLNQRMGGLFNFRNIHVPFLRLQINYNQKYFKFSGKGSSQLNLGKPDILNFDLHFPSLSEQTRIATILSDMDAELEALEQKLSKARQIKQGMMQELLTGRTRLV